jgi:hypothetical protein
MWLSPLYEGMQTYLLGQDVLHADETTLSGFTGYLHSPEERQAERQKRSLPVLEAYAAWLKQ